MGPVGSRLCLMICAVWWYVLSCVVCSWGSPSHIHWCQRNDFQWFRVITLFLTNLLRLDMAMDQYLLTPFLGGWASIYQLFWCSPGVQGFDTVPFWCICFRTSSVSHKNSQEKDYPIIHSEWSEMLTDTVRCLKKRHAKHGMNKSTSASASAFSMGPCAAQ
jgi:hypothetical protein